MIVTKFTPKNLCHDSNNVYAQTDIIIFENFIFKTDILIEILTGF